MSSLSENKCMNMYMHTDLAAEIAPFPSEGVTVSNDVINGFNIHRLTVENARSDLPAVGKYLTINTGRLWLASRERAELAAKTIASAIRELAEPFGNVRSVLVVCLGNRKITSDAIGPLCAEKLIATRHLKRENPELYRVFGEIELSVLTPGVVGETGIETGELVLSAVKTAKPELVITIDALAARSTERLVTSVQLSDAGVSPGSGVGNRRSAIDHKTMCVPVISIGTPTVVRSATLILDALEKAEITVSSPALNEILENERSFFVTPKETDIAVEAQARAIAEAINFAFFGIYKL